jgi:xanthine dehydrogenase accessory factor
MSIFAKLADLEGTKLRFALCTVISVRGSTPRKACAKMIVIDNLEHEGSVIGTIGGGAIEHLTRQQAIRCIRDKRPQLVTTSLRNELGMCCGGEMSIFIEPIIKKPNLFCFGAGHIAQALCPLAVKLGYRVFAVDERADLLNLEAFLDCERLHDVSGFAVDELPFDADCFLVIATHDHALDQRIVERVVDRPYQYAALVGSQRKALMTQKRLLAKGFSEQSASRIRCPAGLKIFATTPEEIALSILAEMTLVKHETAQNSRDDCSGRKEHPNGLSQGLDVHR